MKKEKKVKKKLALLSQLKGFRFDNIKRKGGVFKITNYFYDSKKRNLFHYMISIKSVLEKAGLDTFLIDAEMAYEHRTELSVSFKIWRI